MKDKLQEAAEHYAYKTFVPKKNKKGEAMTIPGGQSVQHGYNKHCKSVTSNFIAGEQYQAEQDKKAIDELVIALETISDLCIKIQPDDYKKGILLNIITIGNTALEALQKHKPTKQ